MRTIDLNRFHGVFLLGNIGKRDRMGVCEKEFVFGPVPKLGFKV